MSEPTQAELNELIATDALFSPHLGSKEYGRRWFVKKIVAYVASASASDVLSKTKTYLEKAKKIAIEYQITTSHAYWPNDNSYSTVARNLLERIIYNVLGVYPKIFLDHSNPELLRFTVERRLRSIIQMRYHVNPNGRYFSYPRGGLASMKIRSTAMTHWVGIEEIGLDSLDNPILRLWPFALSGNGRPVDAVSLLFEKTGGNGTDVNRMDCQSAMMMIMLDSLQTAANPELLFSSLNALGSYYLTIDNPEGGMRLGNNGMDYVGGFAGRLSSQASPGTNVDLFVQPPVNPDLLSYSPTTPLQVNVRVVSPTGQHELVTINKLTRPQSEYIITTKAAATGTSKLTVNAVTISLPKTTRIAEPSADPLHFFNDSRPSNALFEYIKIPRDELQIGDVIHLQSHPLHRSKFSDSAWAGERCMIWNPWTERTWEMTITGHGIADSTILRAFYQPIFDCNILLEVARGILKQCLLLTPGMDIPVDSGTITNNDLISTDKKKNTIQLLIRRALGRFGFFIGDWEVYDLAKLQSVEYLFNLTFELNPNRPLDEKAGYPKHWMLTTKNANSVFYETDPNTRAILSETSFGPQQLFIFAYCRKEKIDSDLGWNSKDFGWESINNNDFTGVNSNCVALYQSALHNSTLTKEKRFVIPYWDDAGGFVKAMPLFYGSGNNVGQRVVLTYNDQLENIFAFTSEDGLIAVYRPRVDDTASYLTYLRSIGAIKPAT